MAEIDLLQQNIQLLSDIKEILVMILVFIVAYAIYLGFKEFSSWLSYIFHY